MPAPTGPLVRFVTGNADKLREVQDVLGIAVEGVALELEELQTTDVTALVRHKLQQAHARVQQPVLVEDTALVFAAWGELPGPFVKHFLRHLGPAGMVRALEPFGDMRAEAVSVIGYHDGVLAHIFEGRVSGFLVPPRGGQGFGWDPVFQPAGSERTYGEMVAADKEGHSMRTLALRQLATHLGPISA